MRLNLPKIIGHRGVKDITPENTILSISHAINLNFKWIEVDVKISKDRIPFLLHDDLLNRTTSGKGFPYNYNYNTIKKLDAGKWFDKKFKNLYPPTLEEILKLCSKKNIGINIELKPNQGLEKENVVSIVKILKKIKFKIKYYFSSFDWYSAVLIKSLLPNSNVGILIDNNIEDKDFKEIIDRAIKYNFFFMWFKYNKCN